MSGFAALGLHLPKYVENVGATLRAAECYGAKMVALSGERVKAKQICSATNVSQAQRKIPVMRGDLRGLIPYGAVPVAVEIIDGAEPLHEFIHPAQAFYVFGPEDGTLGKAVLDWCPRRVFVPTTMCMNLAATVNVVLYDRLAKHLSKQSRAAA